MKFNIYADGELIGSAVLTKGDPPMGVAEGRFFPAPGYEKIRPLVLERREYDFKNDHTPRSEAFYKDWFERFYKFEFTVVAEDGGALYPYGIQFMDFADLLPDEAYPLEVSLQGIPWEEYDRYFKYLSDAYEEWHRR